MAIKQAAPHMCLDPRPCIPAHTRWLIKHNVLCAGGGSAGFLRNAVGPDYVSTQQHRRYKYSTYGRPCDGCNTTHPLHMTTLARKPQSTFAVVVCPALPCPALPRPIFFYSPSHRLLSPQPPVPARSLAFLFLFFVAGLSLALAKQSGSAGNPVFLCISSLCVCARAGVRGQQIQYPAARGIPRDHCRRCKSVICGAWRTKWRSRT